MTRRLNGEAVTARLERLSERLADAIEHLEAGLHGARLTLVEIEVELNLRRPPPPADKASPEETAR